MSRSSPAADEPSPLALLHDEMRRQNGDALASLDAARDGARALAARIRATGRLLMLGMGASHRANRMVLGAYRALGIAAAAEVMSEAIRLPWPAEAGAVPPPLTPPHKGEGVASVAESPSPLWGGVGGGGTARDHAVILTSQSGGSGELRVWLERQGDLDGVFGLTLEAGSLLGRSVPCLVGRGGRERAFAATRSVMLTLALHAAVLEALGMDAGETVRTWRDPPALPPDPPEAAVAALAGCSALVLASRGALTPVLECAALTFMELARTPAFALELGQLVHGPQEVLGAATALVLARPHDADAAGVTRFATAAVSWGVKVVLFDLGGRHPPVEGAATIALPGCEGLPSVVRLLPAVQALAIAAAARRVPDIGVPRRSSKVTDGEAG